MSTKDLIIASEGSDLDGAYQGGSANYTNLNDWNDSTYIYTPATVGTYYHSYNFEDFSEAGVITNVRITFRVMRTQAFQTQTPYVKIGSTRYYGTPRSTISGTATTYTEDWALNPATSSAWTISDLNNAEFGVRSDGAYCYVYDVKLTVTYTPFTFPVVSTLDATERTNVSAVLNGDLTDDGGDTVDYRGFVWDTSQHGDPGDTAPVDSDYSNYWTDSGSFPEGLFDHDVTGLSVAIYYCRACAHNSEGWSYGDEVRVVIAETYSETVDVDVHVRATDQKSVQLDAKLLGAAAQSVSLDMIVSGIAIEPDTGLVTEVECLDYMVQLASGIVEDYKAGTMLTYVSQTDARDGAAYIMAEYGDYIYVAQYASDPKVFKYAKSDMSLVATSGAYGDFISALAVDATHVYIGGGTGQKITKLLASDLSLVAQSADTGGYVSSLAIDDTHIYAGGVQTRIKKYLKSDMSYVAQSADSSNTANTIIIDGDYLYAAGSKTASGHIRKYLKSTLALVTCADVLQGTNIYRMADDDDYLYVAIDNCYSLLRITKDGLSFDGESAKLDGAISAVCVNDDYVFVSALQNTVIRLTRPGLDTVEESPDVGGWIGCMALDDDYLYVSGSTVVYRTKKYSLDDTVEDIIDSLLTYQTLTPAITKGDVMDYASEVREIKADGQTLLRVLQTLRDMTGGYIEVNNDRELNWTSTLGEDKGQQIRYRKNLLGIEREVDYTPLCNRVYAYGFDNSTGKRIRLSEIQTYDYVQDNTSVATYGVIPKTYISFNALSRESLLEWANQLLADGKDPYTNYRITAADLSHQPGFDFDALQVGSTVTVIDEDLGIDVSTTVVKIEHPDLDDPTNMIVEIANATRNIAAQMADIDAMQKQLAVSMLK